MSNRTNQVLAAVALICSAVAWKQGGFQLVVEGVEHGLWSLLRMSPLLLCAFLLSGLAQVLLTKETVGRWVGEDSGWKGISLACVGGSLVPGGPYVYFPIALAMWRGGASIGALVGFVTAKSLWPLARLPMEFALLGPHFTFVRIASTLMVPPILGFLAQVLIGSTFFSRAEADPS